MATKKCENCGFSYESEFDFCPKCGTKSPEIDEQEAIVTIAFRIREDDSDNLLLPGENFKDGDVAPKKTPHRSTPPRSKSSTTATKQNATKSESSYTPTKRSKISATSCMIAFLCCLPLVAELLLSLEIIPQFEVLANNTFLSKLVWQSLALPMKISLISLVVIGVGMQVLGLFEKINRPLAMVTQLVSFALFILSAYAASNNAESGYVAWGLALIVPISLIVAALRYMSADGFGFIDDFNFWKYIPIAIAVAEYALLFLVFPLMFSQSTSLWIFIVMNVTTVAAIAVATFLEDFPWIAVGINLLVAILLCVLCWLGNLFSSEWMANGGAILVAVLAIGGSMFFYWFIHRNDP